MVDSLNWQVGYFKYGEGGYGKSGFNTFKAETLAGLLSPQGGSGAILGFGSNDTVEVKPIGTTTGTAQKISSLIGFINFLKVNQNANVLSTPQVLAMDNQEAELEVGDKVIVGVDRQTTTTGTTETAKFEDAKIKLKIKPFISPSSSSVRMELQASVGQLSAAKTPPGLENTSQPIATRMVKTMIVVPNKDTAVMGGLMKEDDSETINKIPVLGDIPILGWLFKSRGTNREKTNLLMFITPTIVRNPDDSNRILGKKLDQRLNFIKSMGGRDPYGEKMDEIQNRKRAKSSNVPKTEESN